MNIDEHLETTDVNESFDIRQTSASPNLSDNEDVELLNPEPVTSKEMAKAFKILRSYAQQKCNVKTVDELDKLEEKFETFKDRVQPKITNYFHK